MIALPRIPLPFPWHLEGSLSRSLIAVLVFAACTCKPLDARGDAGQESEINITAQYLEYDETGGYILARDSVTVTWEGRTLTADTVEYSVKDGTISASGGVVLTDTGGVMRGESMIYDQKTARGVFHAASGGSQGWFFSADEAERLGEGRYGAMRLSLTTCDLERPHYSVRARRATVRPNKQITVYHARLYLRKIPVFYFPVYVHRMGPHRLQTEVKPGYSRDDGFTAQTIFSYPFTERVMGKAYVDYFGRRGLGTGLECNYVDAGQAQATLYGYHIREETTALERWSSRGAYWQRLSPVWTGQAQADFQSDSSFNNTYFKDDWQRINQQISSYAAFTRQAARTNTRLFVERVDTYNAVTNEFDAASITMPGVSMLMYPVKGSLPFYVNLSGTVRNQYLRTNGYFTYSGETDANITRDWKISRSLTIKPRLGVRENWLSRDAVVNDEASYTSRYYSDVNARWRLTRRLNWDISHAWRVRSVRNMLAIDHGALDYGEEVNQTTFVNAAYLGRTTIRNTVNYNLHIGRLDYRDDWRQGFGPQINEVIWAPGAGASLYFREENIVYPASVKAVQSDLRIGRPDTQYVSAGVFYQAYRPDDLDVNAGFAFWPGGGKKWKFEFTLRSTVAGRMSSFNATDQEIKVYRDLHCWELRLTYRRRITSEDYYLQIDLKNPLANRSKPAYANEELYPFRKGLQ